MKWLGSALQRATDNADAFATAQTSVLAVDFTNSATAVGSIGLNAVLTAGYFYDLDALILFQAAATTTGLKLGFTFADIAAGALMVRIGVSANPSAAALEQALTTTGNVSSSGVSAASTTHAARISGKIKIGATGGTIQLKAASTVAGSLVTVLAGSILTATRLT